MVVAAAARRALALGGLVVVMGCAGILGVDSERESAIAQLCKCDGLAGPTETAIFASPSACEFELSGRLDSARGEVRASWLKTFETANCGNCFSHDACLAAPPICRLADETCKTNAHCCSNQCKKDGGRCL